MFILKTLINKYLGSKRKLFVSYIDFTKAFDTVNRPLLLRKLFDKGVGGKFLKLIKNMYSNTKYSCMFSSEYSHPFTASRGVKQGDNLSPTLFNIFVDDFGSYYQVDSVQPPLLNNYPVSHLFFADDLILMSETSSGLQKLIDQLSQYCTDMKLEVNINKSKAMVFSKEQNKMNDYRFHFNLHTLHIVHEYKYLGLIFTSNGKFNVATQSLADKARKAYFSIRKSIPFNTNLSVKHLLKIYQSMIEPILTYGSEVWLSDFNVDINKADKLPMEKIQNFIIRDILGVHNKSSNIAIKNETGIYPLCIKSFYLMHKYYNRLNNTYDKSKITNKILLAAIQEEQNLHQKNPLKSWQNQLQNLKNKCDIPTLDIKSTLFKAKLESLFKENISKERNHLIENPNVGKLSFYFSLAHEFKLQPYLNFPLKKFERSILTKLRISAHR